MNKEKLNAFTQKIFDDMAGAMASGLCYVGIKSGLFDLIAYKGPQTLEQILSETKLHPRYVEEWLKGMVCAGYLEYESKEQTFIFPDEHAYLLCSLGTDHYAGGLFQMLPACLSVAPKVVEAFTKGGGVAFQEYPEELVDAIDSINRGNYEHRLTNYWLKMLPDVIETLELGGSGLDIGCGVGRVTLTLARRFPKSTFMGLDHHVNSIEQANKNAQVQELTIRVRFTTQTLKELEGEEKFDLITLCDSLHDFSDPIDMLHQIKTYLKPTGKLFIIEPKVADNLEDNCNSIATMFYGFSVFHCLTQSLAENGLGLGTCLGPAKTKALLCEAGYKHIEKLNITSKVNLFYAAQP